MALQLPLDAQPAQALLRFVVTHAVSASILLTTPSSVANSFTPSTA